jgi:hypothetical protein
VPLCKMPNWEWMTAAAAFPFNHEFLQTGKALGIGIWRQLFF